MNLKRLPSRLETLKLSKELDSVLKGGILSNFYQDRGLRISLLKVNTPTGPTRLVYQHGVRFHRTAYAYPLPKQPDQLISKLRDVMRGSRIMDVTQHAFDRILKIDLNSKTGPLKMIVEVMPGGVLAVADQEGKLLYTTEKKKMRDREIDFGLTYFPPPSKFPSPFSSSAEDIEPISKISGSISHVLGTVFGIGNLSRSVCSSLNVDSQSDWMSLSLDEQASVISKVGVFALSMVPNPTLYLSEGVPVDYALVPLRDAPSMEVSRYSSISDVMDAYYTWSGHFGIEAKPQKDSKMEAMKHSAELLRLRSEELRTIASMLMNNVSTFEEALRLARLGKIGPVGENIRIVKIDYDKNVMNVTAYGREVEMDRAISAMSNASRLFDLSKRLSLKSIELESQLESHRIPEKKIRMIELRRIKERPWYEKFRWAMLSTEKMVLLGRDAHSNEVLLRKYAGENDIILHSDMPGSPFGLVWQGGELSESEIQEGATLVASYTSKAWESGFSSLDVFWSRRSQFTKAAPSGTYLSRGSFYVSGKKNYLKGARLGIAIAARTSGEDIEFIALSEKAAGNFKNHALLRPGNESNSKLSERLARLLAMALGVKFSKSLADCIRSKVPNKKSSIAELMNL